MTPTTATVRGRLLGPVQLVVGDTEIIPGSARVRSLLTSLLLRCGQLVPVETLIADVWDDQPPRKARASLHAYTSRLRRDLRGASADETHEETGGARRLLTSHAAGYTLAIDPEDVDANVFTRLLDDARERIARGDHSSGRALLTTALDLWRGPALAGVAPTSRLTAHARRYEEHRLEALSLRIGADLHLGHADAVIPELRTLVADHPERPDFHRQLAAALNRTGASPPH
ncbi:BTAD domain-containing putative transcriptional regulator [Streptomyces sp. M19]